MSSPADSGGAAFLDGFFDPTRPFDELSGEVQEFANRSGLPNALGLGNGLNSVLRPAPNTATLTSHGYTLRTSRGRIIGALQTVADSQARDITVKRQIDRRAHGAPAAVIPQALSTHTVRISRLALVKSRLREAFGTERPWVMLTDQYAALQFRDYWAGAGGVVLGRPQVFNYSGAFFADIGRELSSSGPRIVLENATLIWRRLDQVA